MDTILIYFLAMLIVCVTFVVYYFRKAFKKTTRTKNSEYIIRSKYDYFNFKVAGVTFKNGRKNRQTILRKINFNDAPFDKKSEISISEYNFEGKPALAVYVNDEQIGNVPKDLVEYVLSINDRINAITALEISGGGTIDEESINYGATVTLKLNK